MTDKEDIAAIALLELINHQEAGIAAARKIISEAKLDHVSDNSWHPMRIKWEKAEGASGPYELSEDPENADFRAMHKDLSAHQGKLTRDGYFYWVFRNGATVGRKQKNTVQGESASG